MPQPPHSYSQSSTRQVTVDLSDIETRSSASEAKRQEGFDFSRKFQVALHKAHDAHWKPNASAEAAASQQQSTMAALKTLVTQVPDTGRAPREANLSMRMEDYVRLLAFSHFLETSCLLPPPAFCTDEEYLAGGCMGLAQDLQRYGLGRATVRDVASVQAAALVVSDILDFLLQLDFRNGPLRRKYDGTKWCLRALETLLYELAITNNDEKQQAENGDEKEENDKQTDEPKGKRTKTDKTLDSPRLPNEQLANIKTRMEHRDGLRETMIKRCRDGQKAAKQAIFALHRGDQTKAVQLITTCESIIQNDLAPIVQEEPGLRHGSFANVVEEYVEAKLFHAWLGTNPTNPAGHVMAPAELSVAVEPEEYVGGLCDLTGEVGRLAVQRGTARDVSGVQLCLLTNEAILSSLQMLEHWPAGTGKKLDQVRRSTEKLQRMLYEMSLSEAAGGRNVKSDVELEDVTMTEQGDNG